MQRITETRRGLEVTQGLDTVSFRPDERGDVRIRRKESSLNDESRSRYFIVDGRDNIRDFGEWLTRLSTEVKDDPTPSSFATYIADNKKWVSAVSTVPDERGSGLFDFLLSEGDGLGTDTIEDLNETLNASTEIIEAATDGLKQRRHLVRVENEANAYSLGIPDGMSPMLLAIQTHDQLKLQFDELFIYGALPLEGAKQLGAWSLRGLAEIQKTSIWG